MEWITVKTTADGFHLYGTSYDLWLSWRFVTVATVAGIAYAIWRKYRKF